MRKIHTSLVALFGLFLFATGCGSGGGEVFDLFPVSNGGEVMYIDREGKIVINPQFASGRVFKEGLALVSQSTDEGGAYSFIDKEGKFINSQRFTDATRFSEGKAWVVSEASFPVCISPTGETLFSLREAFHARPFHEGLAAYSIETEEGDRWGFVNAEGTVAINPQFTNVGSFSEGLCGVQAESGKWGFIDSDGVFVINPQFDDLTNQSFFRNGRCVIESNNDCGAIDRSGTYTINPQFDEMVDDGDWFMVEMDGRYGWCDSDGKFIINPQFSEALPFMGNALAPVEMGNKWGYVDREGKIAINPQFDGALPFNGELAWVVQGDKAGMVNLEGKFVVNPQFEFDRYLVMSLLESGGFINYREHAETDFFDVAQVLEKIDLDAPEGLVVGKTTFGEIKEKYDDLSSSYSQSLSEVRVSRNLEFDIRTYGDAYRSYVDRSGWWEETKYKFMPERIPEGYSMRFDLDRKGDGKAGLVYDKVLGSINGYTSIEITDDLMKNDETMKYYKRKVSYEAISLFDSPTKRVVVVHRSNDEVWVDVWHVEQGDV
ncbi:MAG: WG repeat-containing protein [Bacteroidetes bacterium]|nr:WG repeat-containing protein [Bacteroidota bacterium]